MEPVIDPVMKERGKHEGFVYKPVCVCVRPQTYLLLLHDLISCLEDRCILHLDAFSHLLHFLQELCAIPAKKRNVLSILGPTNIQHPSVVHAVIRGSHVLKNK